MKRGCSQIKTQMCRNGRDAYSKDAAMLRQGKARLQQLRFEGERGDPRWGRVGGFLTAMFVRLDQRKGEAYPTSFPATGLSHPPPSLPLMAMRTSNPAPLPLAPPYPLFPFPSGRRGQLGVPNVW